MFRCVPRSNRAGKCRSPTLGGFVREFGRHMLTNSSVDRNRKMRPAVRERRRHANGPRTTVGSTTIAALHYTSGTDQGLVLSTFVKHRTRQLGVSVGVREHVPSQMADRATSATSDYKPSKTVRRGISALRQRLQAAGEVGVDQRITLINGEPPCRRAAARRPLDPQHIVDGFRDCVQVADHHDHSVLTGLSP